MPFFIIIFNNYGHEQRCLVKFEGDQSFINEGWIESEFIFNAKSEGMNGQGVCWIFSKTRYYKENFWRRKGYDFTKRASIWLKVRKFPVLRMKQMKMKNQPRASLKMKCWLCMMYHTTRTKPYPNYLCCVYDILSKLYI